MRLKTTLFTVILLATIGASTAYGQSSQTDSTTKTYQLTEKQVRTARNLIARGDSCQKKARLLKLLIDHSDNITEAQRKELKQMKRNIRKRGFKRFLQGAGFGIVGWEILKSRF